MKKTMIIAMGITIVFAMASIGYGADAVWPPPKAGLLKALSCTAGTSTKYCAVFTLAAGATEVDCKTGDNVVEIKCIPSGAKQKCSNGVIVNQFDSPAMKCQKVCAPPTCTPWR